MPRAHSSVVFAIAAAAATLAAPCAHAEPAFSWDVASPKFSLRGELQPTAAETRIRLAAGPLVANYRLEAPRRSNRGWPITAWPSFLGIGWTWTSTHYSLQIDTGLQRDAAGAPRLAFDLPAPLPQDHFGIAAPASLSISAQLNLSLRF